METFRFGSQNPTSVVAALISAGIVMAIEYQKFHLTKYEVDQENVSPNDIIFDSPSRSPGTPVQPGCGMADKSSADRLEG